MKSKQLQINVKDRVRAAYDLDIRALAISGEKAGAGTPQKTYIKELSREFCRLFDEQIAGDMLEEQTADHSPEETEEAQGIDPATVSKENLMQILQSLRLDGEPVSFFDGNDIKNNEAAMAYAMLQIRDFVLYRENPQSGDNLHHVYLAGNGNLHLIDSREEVRLRENAGVKPQRYRDLYDTVRQEELQRTAGPRIRSMQVELENQTDPQHPVHHGNQAEQGRPAGSQNSMNQRNQAGQGSFVSQNQAGQGSLVSQNHVGQNNPAGTQNRTAPANPVGSDNQTGPENPERTRIGFYQLVSEMGRYEAGMRSGFFHIDSKEYKNVTAALKKITDNWDKPADNPKNLDAMLAAYKELDAACRTYLRERKGAVSSLGQRRLGIISDILKLQERERVVLEVYRSKLQKAPEAAAGKQTVFDIAKEARTVDISGDTATVGAAMSSRIYIKDGPDKGFFTKDEPAPESFMQLVLDKVGASPALSEETKNNIRVNLANADWFDRMRYMKNGGEYMEFFREKNLIPEGEGAEERAARSAYERLAEQIDRKLVDRTPRGFRAEEMWDLIRNSSIPQDGKKRIGDAINANARLRNILRSKNVEELEKYIPADKGRREKNAERLACEKLGPEIADSARSFLSTHLQAGVRPENLDSLNNRAIATSVMASLLGCPDLVAQAQKAEYIEAGGRKVPGMFMEFAPGIGGSDLAAKYPIDCPADLIANEAGIKKQLADMQVLDLICGQGDRHMNNIRWQCDGDERIVSIKGIDHDMSFGEFDVASCGAHAVPLGLVRVVDQATFDFVKDLASPDNRALIEYKFKDLLKASEIDALWNRIDTMAKWLASDHVTKVPTDQWKDQKWENLMLAGNPTSNLLGHEYTPKNLFAKAGPFILPSMSMAAIAMPGHCDAMVRQGLDFEKTTRFERETAMGQHRWANVRTAEDENTPNRSRTEQTHDAPKRKSGAPLL